MAEEVLDQELLQALALDLTGTFPRLLETYQPQLYGFVISQVRCHHNDRYCNCCAIPRNALWSVDRSRIPYIAR